MNVPLPILGSYFKIRDRSIIITGTGGTQLLESNPQRWAAIFQQVGGTTAAIWITQDLGVAGGFQLLTTTLPFVVDFEHYGAACQGEWWGVINPIGNSFSILEIIYMPPAGVT